MTWVMNVDKNPAYPAAVEALKVDGTIPRCVALRQSKYLNNVIEQDHRTIKKRPSGRFCNLPLGQRLYSVDVSKSQVTLR
jgi:transposase-like protein